MSAPVLLIIGAGPNVGASLAKAFAAKGYKIALAARSLNDETTADGRLHIKVDLSNPDNVKGMFEKVTKAWGAPPSVVAYNAAILKLDAPKPLPSFSPTDLATSLAINTTSAILSLSQSILGFSTLPPSSSKTFLYTGNCLNVKLIPGLLTFGISKNATAYAIWSAASTEEYTGAGMKFYYVDERSAEGGAVGNQPSAEESAEVGVMLSEGERQGDWDYVWSKGKGEVSKV